MKASAFRRWPVTLGLIARVQTTRWTGGHDSEEELNDMLDSAKQNIEEDKIKSNEYKSLNIDDHVLKKYIKDKMIENENQEEFNKRVKIKEEDIKKYYKDKINEFKEKEFDCYQIWIKNPNDKIKAENAYKDLKKGMDFSTVVKKYSEDENSKNKGGYIGKIKKENLIPELREKALIMRDKEYTGVVKSKDGYFIIKIDNQRNLTKTLDSCRTKIKDDLLEKLYQENNKKIINRIGVKYYKDNIKKIKIQL
ncbi:peptidylprolyl isomerase [Peptostreptococcus anaerobius]|uniref:peptidylprolyl isomerase n=1 Tax=Peptostreptococcus anaerobius TaxID=1261 RepID=UPI003D6F3C1B